MKTKNIYSRKKILIAIALAVLTVFTVFALTVSGTLADSNDIVVALSCESGITGDYTIEVGQTRNETVGRLNQARSGDMSYATVTYTTSGLDNLHITGRKAGVVTIAYGTYLGVVSADRYQITDSRNISAYVIKDGGTIRFEKTGETKPIPVTVTTGTNNIEWRSLNQAIASVNTNTGMVSANSKGVAIIVGEFTDKWGVFRDIHILVGVGVSLDGIDVPGGPGDPGGPGGPGGTIIGPDGEGNHYKPVNMPPNVFEVVDENGNPYQPPQYVYNPDGDPTNGNNAPALPDGIVFYVEDPEGSNIWKPVGPGGGLDENNAVWGGGNGKPGGGDDKPVTNFGGDYWVDMGQNVWSKVDENNPRGPLGSLTSGGPDRDPAATGGKGRPIYTDGNGQFYLEAGKDSDGNDMYYGDPWTPGSDKQLNSTTDGPAVDDVIYYKDGDGNMTKTKPPKPITQSGTGNAVDGRILDKDVAGDTADWIEIARNGDYSLIVRSRYILINGAWSDTSANQETPFSTSDGRYAGSFVQTRINGWFDPDSLAPQRLAADANLRNYTVKNTALYTLGSGSIETGAGRYDGFSSPVALFDRTGHNVAFALSFGEVTNYFSTNIQWDGGLNDQSGAIAKSNFEKLQQYLSGYTTGVYMWLRSPGVNNNQACVLYIVGNGGRVYHDLATNQGLVYPALWVHSDIFNG